MLDVKVVEYGLVVFGEYMVDVCSCLGVYFNVDCLLVIVEGGVLLVIEVIVVGQVL